mmetsp:Transcript_3881/g.9043  ORF Transcript_3881/g.9043 Transcript_3881/m.9043 type:complete len:242 (+) Transcript_3881:706-1431(+)
MEPVSCPFLPHRISPASKPDRWLHNGEAHNVPRWTLWDQRRGSRCWVAKLCLQQRLSPRWALEHGLPSHTPSTREVLQLQPKSKFRVQTTTHLLCLSIPNENHAKLVHLQRRPPVVGWPSEHAIEAALKRKTCQSLQEEPFQAVLRGAGWAGRKELEGVHSSHQLQNALVLQTSRQRGEPLHPHLQHRKRPSCHHPQTQRERASRHLFAVLHSQSVRCNQPRSVVHPPHQHHLLRRTSHQE